MLAMTHGAPIGPIYERIMLISAAGEQAVTVENNIRVTAHRSPAVGYGVDASYFRPGQAEAADDDGASLVWEPDFSLGQLYNKGLFTLGYWGELNEFIQSILQGRPPGKGTLDQAWQATRIFEAFSQGPDKLIHL